MDHHRLHDLLKHYSSTTASSIPQPDVEVFFYYNNLHIIEGLARVAFINPGSSTFTVPAPPPVVAAGRLGAGSKNIDNQTECVDDEGGERSDSSSESDEDVRKQVENGLNRITIGTKELDGEELDSSTATIAHPQRQRNGRSDRTVTNNRKNNSWTVYAAVETHHPLPLLFMRPVVCKKKLPLTPRPSEVPCTAAATSVQFNTVLADIHEPLARNNSQRLLLNPKKYGVTYVTPVQQQNQQPAAPAAYDNNDANSNDIASAIHYQRRLSLINNTWASSSALSDHSGSGGGNNAGHIRNIKPTPIPRPSNFSTAPSNNSLLLQRQNTTKLMKDPTNNHYYDLTRQNSSNVQQQTQQRQRRASVVKPVEPHNEVKFGPFRAFHHRRHHSSNNGGHQSANGGTANNQFQQQASVNGGFGAYDDVQAYNNNPRIQYSPSNGGGAYNSNSQPFLSVSPLLSGNIGSGTAAAYTERGIFGLVEELSLLPAPVAVPKPEPILRMLEPRTSTGVKQSGSRGSILLMQSRLRGRRMSKPSILNQLIARSEGRASGKFNESTFSGPGAASNGTAAFRTTPQVKATVEQPFLIVTMFGSTQSETASKRFEDNWFNTTLAHYVLNNIPKTFRLRCVRFLRRKTTFLTAPLLNQQEQNSNDMLTNYYAGGSGYYQQQQQLQQQQKMQTIQYICTIEVMPTAASILASAVNLKIDLAKQNECELLREILTAELLNFVIKLRAFYVGIVGVYERVNSKPRSENLSRNKRREFQQQEQTQEVSNRRLVVAANVHPNNLPTTPSPTNNNEYVPPFSGKHDFSSLLAERRHSSLSSGSWQLLRRRNRRNSSNVSRGSVESLGNFMREPTENSAHQQYGGSAMQINNNYRQQQLHYHNNSQHPSTVPMYLMRSEQQMFHHHQPQPGSAGPHSGRMVHASPTLTAMYVEDERSPFGGSVLQRLAAAKRHEQQAKQQQQEAQKKKKPIPSSVPIGLRRLDSDGAGSDNDSERRHRSGAMPWAFPFYGGKWKIPTPQ